MTATLIGDEEVDCTEVHDLREAVKDLRDTVSADMAETAELLRAHVLVARPAPVPPVPALSVGIVFG